MNHSNDICALRDLLDRSDATQGFKLAKPRQKLKVTKPQKNASSDDIWDNKQTSEVLDKFVRLSRQRNGRKQPKFEFKNRMDMSHGKMLVVSVHLPDQDYTNIDVQIGEDWLVVGASQFFLATHLPDKVKVDENGSTETLVCCKWEKRKDKLIIAMPLKIKHFME